MRSVLDIALMLPYCLRSAQAYLMENRSTAYCWTELAPIAGGKRQENSVVALNNSVYVVGGLKKTTTSPQNITASVEVYNIDSDKWSEVAPLPVALHHPNTAVVGGKIYVLGGITGFEFPTWKAVPNSYIFDPSIGQWATITSMPNGTERGSSVVGVKGSIIYLAGGFQPNSKGRNALPLVSSYDTVSGQWSLNPNLPEARDHSGGGFVGDTFYVVAGRVEDRTNVRDTVFALKFNASGWEILAPMPSKRGGVAVARVGPKFYVFGGEGNPNQALRGVFPEVEAYDTVNNTWEKEPAMRIPRHGTNGVGVGDKIYIPGGGAEQGGGDSLDINEVYGPGLC